MDRTVKMDSSIRETEKMIICFNCSSRTKEVLDILLESGQYKDYAEIISVAAENLNVLQKELAHQGAIIIGEKAPETFPIYSQTTDDKTLLQKPVSQPDKDAKKRRLNKRMSKTTDLTVSEPIKIPEVFHKDNIKNPPTPLASLPSDVWTEGQEVPLDRWLFGQYNKLLPAKANCRALANLLNDKPEGVTVDEAASKIAEEAAILGNFLRYHDKRNGIGRDDALSTAFPSIGDNTKKSRLRYANHFVASVNAQGQISGLLIDLKLINYRHGKNTYLLLTKAGWQFAAIRNPVLDGRQEVPTQKFSQEEKTFLLDHIAHFVPAENFSYRRILAAIAKGANTPDKLDASLGVYISNETKRGLSKSFLSSQRSGAISRMADLELVTRVRDGVRVSYSITETGEQYAESAQEHVGE